MGPLFWRVFGGMAVGVIALIAMTVYMHMQSQINRQRRELASLNKQLQRELARIGGGYSTLIKKDDHNNKMRTVWDTIKELRSDRGDLTTMKERCSGLLDAYRAAEGERRALAAEVTSLRESNAADEERDTLAREVRLLRERLAQLEGKPVKATTQTGHAEEEQQP